MLTSKILPLFLKRKLQVNYQFRYYCSHALLLCNKLFSVMSPIVLEWSPSTEQFETAGPQSSKYWKWYFNTFIVAGVIGFGCCLDVIAHAKETGGALVVLSCGLGAMSFLFWASAATVIWKVDEILNAQECYKKIWIHLGKQYMS